MIMTLRLPADLYYPAKVVAKNDGQSFNEMVRIAIDEYIESRIADPEFQRKLTLRMRNELRIYERLHRRT